MSMFTVTDSGQVFTLTDAAAKKVSELMAAEESSDELVLRVAVRPGGCSGFSYFVDFVAEPEATDKSFEFDGLKVCVDKKSYLFLNGTEVDFEQSLVKQGFVFHNPSAKRSCSCGESFSI